MFNNDTIKINTRTYFITKFQSFKQSFDAAVVVKSYIISLTIYTLQLIT